MKLAEKLAYDLYNKYYDIFVFIQDIEYRKQKTLYSCKKEISEIFSILIDYTHKKFLSQEIAVSILEFWEEVKDNLKYYGE